MRDSPSTFVENSYNRKYAEMDPISRNSFNTYKDRIHMVVEKKIRNELPLTFLFYFSGWTCDGEHYLCMFASDGEHYLCMFATWTNKSGGVVVRFTKMKI